MSDFSNITIPTGYYKPLNENPYIGEPAIVDGDLEKKGGDYRRNYGIDNMIYILLYTNAGYWGNLIEKESSQIAGGLESLDGEAITSSFLKRDAAKKEELLQPLIKNGIASSIKAESFNSENDRVDSIIKIVMTDGRKYFFDTRKGGSYTNNL